MSGQRVVVADADGKIVADSDNKLIGKQVGYTVAAPRSAVRVSGDRSLAALYLDPLGSPPDPDAAFLAAVNRSVLFGALIAGLAAVVVTLASSRAASSARSNA